MPRPHSHPSQALHAHNIDRGRGDSRRSPDSEEQYRLLFEHNPCPMWICDEKTLRFLDVNAAALRLYGWPRRSFLRMSARNIRPAEDLNQFLQVVRAQRHAPATFVGEWRHMKRNGTVFDVEVTISSLIHRGRPSRLVLVNDIAERKQAELRLKQLNATLERRVAERTEELLEGNERLQAIMDTALVGIITLDERGIIETFNPVVLQIFGHTAKELRGANINRLLASPDQPQGTDFLTHYLRVRKTRLLGARDEVLGWRRDGVGIILELSLAEYSEHGRRCFVAMLREITARKRLERELLEISERERQRIGRDLHDGLGQHLHGISYLAELLEKGLREEGSARADEVGQLNKYLQDALELTRGLAHGLQPVTSVPQGLMMALRELAERTSKLYRVDCRFQCRVPVVIHRHSAATHLYRIAQEAVNNAMKHGKPTRIRIRLAALRQRVLLGIRDNGAGIRLAPNRARGMGLHIMQYRADALSGSLLVQKHPQGGTEVVCTVNRPALLPQEDNHK